MNKGLDFYTEINRAQAVFAIITMIIFGIAPLLMTVYFRIRINNFRNALFLLRFSSIIGDFNYRERMCSLFISIFCYRRLVEAVLIVFLPSKPYAQVQIMTISCVFVVIMFGYSNVYQMTRNR